jgi:hypothetical protein
MFKITLRAALFGVGLSSANLFAAAPASDIQILPCDQPVKSAKRGICLNKMDRADFMAVAPGVSWWYNWHYKDTQNAPKEANMEFLPMAWGDRKEDLAGLKSYLASNKPSVVLAINEPNLKDQAFIPPQQTARLYKDIKAIADAKGIPVVGPHMALGSPENGSITAEDPIEKKKVTYTFMSPFLKAFFHYMGDTEVPAVAAHSYGNFGELKWMTGMLHDEFKRPVWVTEFADWHAKDAEAEIDYLVQSVDFFERTPFVAGYAWFKERVGGNQKLSLLGKSGELTPLGQAYVNMPVHDPKIYYRLPGKLEAERYVTMNGAEIARTKDADGFLEMRAMGPQNTIDYNVAPTSAGRYKVDFRFAAKNPTTLELLSGGKVLAKVDSTGTDWQNAQAAIDLPAGPQTLQFRSSAPVRLNWINFQL